MSSLNDARSDTRRRQAPADKDIRRNGVHALGTPRSSPGGQVRVSRQVERGNEKLARKIEDCDARQANKVRMDEERGQKRAEGRTIFSGNFWLECWATVPHRQGPEAVGQEAQAHGGGGSPHQSSPPQDSTTTTARRVRDNPVQLRNTSFSGCQCTRGIIRPFGPWCVWQWNWDAHLRGCICLTPPSLVMRGALRLGPSEYGQKRYYHYTLCVSGIKCNDW